MKNEYIADNRIKNKLNRKNILTNKYETVIVLIAFLVLLIIGNYNLSSAVENSRFIRLSQNQPFWTVMGITVSVLVPLFVNKIGVKISTIMGVLFSFITLLAVLRFGENINGSVRWFETPLGSVQPSEISKPVMILALAYIFSEIQDYRKAFTLGAVLTLIIAGLIGKEDLGTSIVFIFLFIVIYFITTRNIKKFVFFMVILLLAALIFFAFCLDNYQANRIKAFFSPEDNPDTYYQTKQSIIMVGSGGVDGKGYKRGPGNLYGFIPADHTDFVLSVYAEENGFKGMLIFLGLWTILLLSILNSALKSSGMSRIISMGVFSVFFFQFSFNTAMVLGVVPVTGLPLPFFTYGGSSMLSNSIMIGLFIFSNVTKETNNI